MYLMSFTVRAPTLSNVKKSAEWMTEWESYLLSLTIKELQLDQMKLPGIKFQKLSKKRYFSNMGSNYIADFTTLRHCG